MNPEISVVIPAYNRAKTIHEPIDGALAQEPKIFEIIVVDDGSSDKTADVVAMYGQPVRLVQKANGGVSSARNAGIKAAHGKYIAFLDSDDLWMPGKLAAKYAYLQSHPDIPLVYTDEYTEIDGVRESETRFQKHPPVSRIYCPSFLERVALQT